MSTDAPLPSTTDPKRTANDPLPEDPVNNSTEVIADVCSAENENANVDNKAEPPSCARRSLDRLIDEYYKWEFPLLIIVAILIAYAYPPLGAVYVAPQITAGWIAVCYIFLLSGMGLKTSEFAKAFKRIYFNAFVQVFNFMVVSAVVYGVSRLLIETGVLQRALADGMLICSCLPMAINVVIILSTSTGGDEAAAIFNSTFGNLVGIFLSPVLILMYIGQDSDINLVDVFYKLALRVVLPLVVGQVIQKFWVAARDFYMRHKRRFKKSQEYALVFIVYTVFCKTFTGGSTAGIGDVFTMIAFLFLLMTSLMVVAWYSLRLLFPKEPELRVMGLFGCVQKTVALGIPLISSIYGNDANVGLYTLPILIWHPMQLVVGSMLVPRLTRFIVEERERLGPKPSKRQLPTDSTIALDVHSDHESAEIKHHGSHESDEELGQEQR